MKRAIAYIAVALVAVVAGVYVGYRWLLIPHLWLGAVGESHLLAEHAWLEYREGSYADAQQALTSYIAYLNGIRPSGDSWHPGESPWLDTRGLRVEKTLAWSRLAILHERNGNQASADRAWQQAEGLAKQGNWRDLSRANLRRVVLQGEESMAKQPAVPKRLPNPG